LFFFFFFLLPLHILEADLFCLRHPKLFYTPRLPPLSRMPCFMLFLWNGKSKLEWFRCDLWIPIRSGDNRCECQQSSRRGVITRFVYKWGGCRLSRKIREGSLRKLQFYREAKE
jgi:hypothetical protein